MVFFDAYLIGRKNTPWGHLFTPPWERILNRKIHKQICRFPDLLDFLGPFFWALFLILIKFLFIFIFFFPRAWRPRVRTYARTHVRLTRGRLLYYYNVTVTLLLKQKGIVHYSNVTIRTKWKWVSSGGKLVCRSDEHTHFPTFISVSIE